MDRSLNYLGLARKAGLAELGEEPAGAAARGNKAVLILVAEDASNHTWRRAQSFVAGTEQKCIRIPFTKDQLGEAVGRTALAIGAFTDPALALAFAKALPQPSPELLESLQKRVDRIAQRQKEEKAHQRNKRTGKKK